MLDSSLKPHHLIEEGMKNTQSTLKVRILTLRFHVEKYLLPPSASASEKNKEPLLILSLTLKYPGLLQVWRAGEYFINMCFMSDNI